MSDVDDVARRHAFHPLPVKQVIEETDDTRSFVLDVPDDLTEAYHYRPGQFCTFRVRIGTDEHFRCYSMSSAPETDGDLAVTVKRVPGGTVSNWFNDKVSVGDLVATSPPSGAFCLRGGDRPVVGFCGGSGITPVISLAKSALSSTGRPVRLLYASREPHSVIFDDALRSLETQSSGRLSVRRHFDSVSGFPGPEAILDVVGGELDADFYVCGPAPFMELVEETLLGAGVAPGAILIERFVTPEPGESPPVGATDAPVPATIVLQLKGRRHEIAYHAGDTVLETARRASLPAPYSCEAGSCATCMALLHEGTVTMRVNNALTPDEVEEGWVLTCQSVPTSPSLRVEYERL
ncbi:MAG: 2Fe-2S iron-sulfur cluster-binding protein [Acidimicrobiales bacterium]